MPCCIKHTTRSFWCYRTKAQSIISLSRITHQMWCNYPFSQQNQATKRAVGVEVFIKQGGRNPLPTICIDAAQQCSSSDVPKRIFIPVYWYGCPNYGTQKKKYTFIYSDVFCPSLYFFLLNRIKVCFQVRKHTLSIVNHPKAEKICSYKEPYLI